MLREGWPMQERGPAGASLTEALLCSSCASAVVFCRGVVLGLRNRLAAMASAVALSWPATAAGTGSSASHAPPRPEAGRWGQSAGLRTCVERGHLQGLLLGEVQPRHLGQGWPGAGAGDGAEGGLQQPGVNRQGDGSKEVAPAADETHMS